DADRTTHYTEMDFNESVTDRYDRIAADDSRGLSTDLSLEFRHDIEARGHDITVELEYQRGRDMQESLVRQRLIDEIIDADPTIELTLDDTREHQNDLGMRIDYTRPLGGRGQFEIGYRGQWGDNLDGRLRQ